MHLNAYRSLQLAHLASLVLFTVLEQKNSAKCDTLISEYLNRHSKFHRAEAYMIKLLVEIAFQSLAG